MTDHPWLAPSAALVAKVGRARALAVVRKLTGIPSTRFGSRKDAWPPLLAALPALLRADAGRVLDAVGRIDVSSALLDLAEGPIDAGRTERALVSLWLAIAGHPGLTTPLALPGPFRERVVDPGAPRLIALGEVRGLAATARGPVVIGRAGRLPIDGFVAAPLPAVNGTLIVDERLGAPDGEVVARVGAALALVQSALPGGRLERVTIGDGAGAYGEARVDDAADPADLVSSAQAAFTRAAAALEPVLESGGVLVERGGRHPAVEVLARACGNAVALPWRRDRARAAAAVVDALDDLAVLADLTAAGAELVAALRVLAGDPSGRQGRALLVNVDADDFVYSFQFGRSVERRCVERDLRVDRITINTGTGRDLTAELGQAIPPPVADGTETVVDSEQDPLLGTALRRLSARRYDVVVTNVRSRLFCDLFAAGLLAFPTLVWDRHLHGGLREECARRGLSPGDIGGLRMRAWSLADKPGQGLLQSLVDVGFQHGSGHAWPMDLEFFRSTATCQPERLFAGGDSGRDWPLFVEAIRDLPLDVHLVTAHAPAPLPAHVRVDARLPLWRFRDAMAAATVTAIPLLPDIATGVTVLPMAMALGVAVVATRTQWTAQYVTDGEEALLVPPGDPGAFRDALVRLYEQPDLRARLVENARRRVAVLCDLEAFTREMFATLD